MKTKKLTTSQVKKFQNIIWDFYKNNSRDLPWRKTQNPYHIVVSEIMLQQTQVGRVKTYYVKFLQAFPDWETLAKASIKDVLTIWQGMGYNRRALFLQRAAHIITQTHKGKFPTNTHELLKLPGVGKATAGAVLAYAYNTPVVFIETNIRRIFIYHFFANKKDIHDHNILPLIKQTLPVKNIREWYWALMDYGSFLPKKVTNPNRNSKHYSKQSIFEGSRRQLRANIIKLLLTQALTVPQLALQTKKPITEIELVLSSLIYEGFIEQRKNTCSIVS